MKLAPDARPYKSGSLELEGERLILRVDVLDSIKRLSPKLCAGHDGIPSKAVKAVAPISLLVFSTRSASKASLMTGNLQWLGPFTRVVARKTHQTTGR